jgi:hypothetical protein
VLDPALQAQRRVERHGLLAALAAAAGVAVRGPERVYFTAPLTSA